MLFYKVQGIIEDKNEARAREKRGKTATKGVFTKIDDEIKVDPKEVLARSERYNENVFGHAYCFVSDAKAGLVTVGVITESSDSIEAEVGKYLKYIGVPLKDISCNEVTFGTLVDMLSKSDMESYINDEDDVLDRFKLVRLARSFGSGFGENMVSNRERGELEKAAVKWRMSHTVIPELDRIYHGVQKKRFYGHPVHYIMRTDDLDVRREVCRILLDALYANKRLCSRRYSFVDIPGNRSFSPAMLDTLYKSSEGSAVIVRYAGNGGENDDDEASNENVALATACDISKRYRNKVLTIFCVPEKSAKIRADLVRGLGDLSLIELEEDRIDGADTVKYLSSLARADGVRVDKHLFEKLEQGKEYIARELNSQYDKWYNGKLKRTLYPQYKAVKSACREISKTESRGSAYEELQSMIGLSEVKAVINKALSYYKVQKLYEQKGVKRERPAMHMVFTGNPGTAKTTVARLFARIMRDNGLIESGSFVEVGRGDLVGKYVGWTAKTVKAKFEEAIGGVLFIDEAYSLVDDRNGSYGDEAINTIVQEMENYREDVIVIFAGYPDKMEELIERNPGFRSRIAFYVPFRDYDASELCDIARLIGKRNGMTITDGAIAKLSTLFEDAKKKNDFGNGRYVRNIFEQAKMNQATRLAELDFDSITTEQVTTIIEDDIVIPEKRTEPVRLGFC